MTKHENTFQQLNEKLLFNLLKTFPLPTPLVLRNDTLTDVLIKKQVAGFCIIFCFELFH